MKITNNRKFISLIAAFFVLSTLSACSNAELQENTISFESIEATYDEHMPSPFDSGSMGGDANAAFYQPCIRTLDSIPLEIMRLRDEVDVNDWINSFPSIYDNAPSNIYEYANLFSFITYFEITEDEAEKALAVYLESDDEQIKISRQEFDVIFSGDVKKITETFASEYSIVVKDSIYCPNWVYYHTSYDYELAGISNEDISEKVLKYSDFNFVNEARTAFEKKLSSFTSVKINIDPIKQNNNIKNNVKNDDVFDIGIEDNETYIEIEEIE